MLDTARPLGNIILGLCHFRFSNDRVGPDRDNIRMVMSYYNEKCVRFIEKIRNSESAPMVNWLSFSQGELGVCSGYSSTLTEEDFNQFIRYLLKNDDPRA